METMLVKTLMRYVGKERSCKKDSTTISRAACWSSLPSFCASVATAVKAGAAIVLTKNPLT